MTVKSRRKCPFCGGNRWTPYCQIDYSDMVRYPAAYCSDFGDFDSIIDGANPYIYGADECYGCGAVACGLAEW